MEDNVGFCIAVLFDHEELFGHLYAVLSEPSANRRMTRTRHT